MPNCGLNRRRFLGISAGLAAGSIAAPYFVSDAFGKKAGGKGLAVAAIGVGGRGSQIGRQAAGIGKMVACCDVHRGNGKHFARAVGGCKTYVDYRELLEKEKGIGAVIIGTPDHWHVKIAIDAMKAGKHVYSEKPLTLTLEEGRLIQDAVKKYGKVFQVGTQQRSEFGSCFLKAVAIARSGHLGKKLHAISSVGAASSRAIAKNDTFGPFHNAATPGELQWDLWLGQAPAVPFCENRLGWNFRWWYEYSGGQVTDWGVHHTDIAFWALAGKDGQAIQAEPKSFEPMGVPLAKSRDFLLGKIAPKDMPNAYNVAHKFDVNITLSTGNEIKLISGPNELVLAGERGKIRVNRKGLSGKLVEQLDKDPKTRKEIADLMVEIYGGPVPKSAAAHMQNFFDCIANGKQPVANVFDHVRAVNACHMANIALLTGRKVAYDPTAGNFGADAEANGLMKRKRRAPYEITL